MAAWLSEGLARPPNIHSNFIRHQWREHNKRADAVATSARRAGRSIYSESSSSYQPVSTAAVVDHPLPRLPPTARFLRMHVDGGCANSQASSEWVMEAGAECEKGSVLYEEVATFGFCLKVSYGTSTLGEICAFEACVNVLDRLVRNAAALHGGPPNPLMGPAFK